MMATRAGGCSRRFREDNGARDDDAGHEDDRGAAVGARWRSRPSRVGASVLVPAAVLVWLLFGAASCAGAAERRGTDEALAPADAVRATTSGALAIVNLDHQIERQRGGAGVDELLLLRSRFLGDYDALDEAIASAEAEAAISGSHLPRARARSAVHRFPEALDELVAAERAGEAPSQIAAQRASIAVATGGAASVLAQLESDAAAHPGYASYSALGNAYAAVGRYADADRSYVAALDDLSTTSPFPYAWLYFVRGMMWTEQAGEAARGERLYLRALAYVPAFVTANVHVAELEAARGDLDAAITRLERVVATIAEPEALATLGILHLRRGERDRGQREVAAAVARYEQLLAGHPLAFADHAAELYLGAGNDPARAWVLAQQNLGVRPTPRAFALALAAAAAAGHDDEARALRARAPRIPRS